MFDSIKNWLGRGDRHEAEKRRLEEAAKEFRIPSETLPQIFKYIFFVGLACLNYRLFSHTVPGVWGQFTGVVAVIAEAIALYSLHYFSRSSGLFRAALGASGFLLMAFSLAHGTCSMFDLIGVLEVSDVVRLYARIVAFPLLAGLVGLSVITLTMTHPKNIIRLKQAAAHTRIAIGKAETASELELMRSQSILDRAKRDQHRERIKFEEEELADLQRLIAVEERKAELVARISNPQLRESVARELGIDLRQPQGGAQHPTPYQSPNWGPRSQSARGNGALQD